MPACGKSKRNGRVIYFATSFNIICVFFADACFFLFLYRFYGVEICHDGVWKDRTIVWCKSARDCEVRLQVSCFEFTAHDFSQELLSTVIDFLNSQL